MDAALVPRTMRSPTNTSVTHAFGTPGTDPTVRGIAVLVAGLVLGACGGETNKESAKSSTDGGGTTAIAATTGSGSTSQGAAVTSGTTSSGTVAGNTFGSGPSTSTGGSTSTSTGSGGAAGASGIGGASGAGGAPPTCEAQDVAGVGACDAAFGVFFLGSGCGWVSGCSCEGADCDSPYPDEASCELANRGCSTGCTPQDITLVGSCEPGPIYAFNGTECVPMVGCDCVGEDCDKSYRSLAECQSAHAVCAERERSCEDIAAAYDDYVSRTACTEDFDCQIAYGLCGIGLGGCYHAQSRRWGEDGVRALGQEWLAAGCGGPVCDCPTPPEAAVCDLGTCVPGP